jgi:hypothetical protein
MLPAHLLDILRTGETTGRFAQGLESFVGILEDEAMELATQELAVGVVAFNILCIIIAVTGARMF